jgi:hypothetical protein
MGRVHPGPHQNDRDADQHRKKQLLPPLFSKEYENNRKENGAGSDRTGNIKRGPYILIQTAQMIVTKPMMSALILDIYKPPFVHGRQYV